MNDLRGCGANAILPVEPLYRSVNGVAAAVLARCRATSGHKSRLSTPVYRQVNAATPDAPVTTCVCCARSWYASQALCGCSFLAA
jgi:hypothetical protein